MNVLGKLKEVFSGKEELQEQKQEIYKDAEKKQEEKKPARMPDAKEAMEADPKKKPIVEVLKTIEDPELGIDIWNLGLIYNIDLEEKTVHIRMTFTSIMCPVGPMIVESVQKKVKEVKNVEEVKVEVTFDPVWEPSEELREMLGV